MSEDWTLVFRGLFIASVGAVSTILYVISISAAYVGRFSLSVFMIAIGSILAWGFLRMIGAYLDGIDRREAAEAAAMNPERVRNESEGSPIKGEA